MQQPTPEDPQSQLDSHDQDMSSIAEPPRPNVMSTGAPEDQQPLFYTQEDDLDLPLIDDQDEDDQSDPFVFPFQSSLPLPAITPREAGGTQTQGATGVMASGTPQPSSRRAPWRLFPVGRMLLIVGVVLATIFGAGFFVLAQSGAQPEVSRGKGRQTSVVTMPSSVKATQAPSPHNKVVASLPTANVLATPLPNPPPSLTPGTQGDQNTQGNQSTPENQSSQGNPSNTNLGIPRTVAPSPTVSLPSTQVLNQMGWTQAGLSLSDAFDALRTGATFADREMSYDYRNIGTVTNHSGTLTGAVFLLTSGGQVRFAHYDKRAINNILYNQIQSRKIIQQIVQTQATLVRFQVVPIQGYAHQFAWVNVSFELFQSELDPSSGRRMESLDLISTTGQPLIHNLMVLLIRVPPQNQGVNAPMGGTGWLVNTYELDPSILPPIATAPFL